MINFPKVLNEHFSLFYSEDDLAKNFTYLSSLPTDVVQCSLKVKDNLRLAGLPLFFEAFNFLSKDSIDYQKFLEFEGKDFSKTDDFSIEFNLPFNIALTGERIALNLVQRGSSIASFTKKFVQAAGDIKVLDTRKTTPGLRFLEKYAVNIGGGYNHRFGQMDAWMVKDNHKEMFGGIKNAIEYFQNMNSFYQPIIIEIHDLNELKLGYEAGGRHFLLDNFSPSDIKKAIDMKQDGMTYEVSGGINLENMNDYRIKGVDAFSSGSLTYNAPHVDLSLKFKRKQ